MCSLCVHFQSMIPLKTPVTFCFSWEGWRQMAWQNGSKLPKFCFGGQRRDVLFEMCLCFRKCDVMNRGISGYNTRWAKLILPRLITESTSADSIVAVTIFFGANDSALKGRVACFLSFFPVTCSLKMVLQFCRKGRTFHRLFLHLPQELIALFSFIQSFVFSHFICI